MVNKFPINEEIKQGLIAKQIEILDYLYDFCLKNNIKVSLSYGTLLGAVRHKGYIPWDHDIDVMMPRDDYERFIKLYQRENHKYFLQTYQTDKDYPWSFCKLRDSNTTFIEPEYANTQMNQGIWVDIFVYDKSANNLLLRRIQYALVVIRYEIFKTKYIQKTSVKKVINRLFCYSPIMTLINNIIIFLGLGSSYYADFTTNCTLARMRVDHLFDNFAPQLFEGKEYPCIKDIDEYLKVNYGNYMQLPEDASLEHELDNLSKCIIDYNKPFYSHLNQ